jgi:hypothetical protein
MKIRSKIGQRGISITGLIFVLAILGFVGILGLKVVPTVTEYMAIRKAITTAKVTGGTVAEVRNAFDRNAGVTYIDSIAGKDLDIVKNGNGDGFDVSFAYQKVIPLVGPTSLLIDYEGSTAPTASKLLTKKKTMIE